MLNSIRIARILAQELTKKSTLDTFDEVVRIKFKVMMADCDFNGHMTNSRYAALCDYANYTILIRLGLLNFLLKKQAAIIIDSQETFFIKSLALYQNFCIESFIEKIDKKHFYFVHKFIHASHVVAVHRSRAILLSRGKKIVTQEAFGSLVLSDNGQNRSAAWHEHMRTERGRLRTS